MGNRPLVAKKGVRGVDVRSLLSANSRQRMCLVRFFFAQNLKKWIKESICIAKIIMMKRKEKVYIAMCSNKWVRPPYRWSKDKMNFDFFFFLSCNYIDYAYMHTKFQLEFFGDPETKWYTAAVLCAVDGPLPFLVKLPNCWLTSYS